MYTPDAFFPQEIIIDMRVRLRTNPGDRLFIWHWEKPVLFGTPFYLFDVNSRAAIEYNEPLELRMAYCIAADKCLAINGISESAYHVVFVDRGFDREEVRLRPNGMIHEGHLLSLHDAIIECSRLNRRFNHLARNCGNLNNKTRFIGRLLPVRSFACVIDPRYVAFPKRQANKKNLARLTLG